jgi:hypothetical protein
MARRSRSVLTTNRPKERFVADLWASPSSFASQVTAAVDGQTICLTAGSYGTWTGTNKRITIRPAPGVSPTMSLDLATGDGNFTIDGGHTEIKESTNGMVRGTSFTSPGITLGQCIFDGTPGPQNITIKRCWLGPANNWSGGYMEFLNCTNTNIVVDRCWFNQLDTNPSGEASMRFGDDIDMYITVKNCYFSNSSADSVKIGGGRITVLDCEFDFITIEGDEALHTDCVQFFVGSDCTLKRNYFHSFNQALGGFDGTSGHTIEDNVCAASGYDAQHWISMYGDNPASTVNHNTCDGPIQISAKSGSPASLTSLTNNISTAIDLFSSGGPSPTPSANTNNLYPGAGSPNISGTATFVGGAIPTTYQGYRLRAGTTGTGAGSDGLNVGARIL